MASMKLDISFANDHCTFDMLYIRQRHSVFSLDTRRLIYSSFSLNTTACLLVLHNTPSPAWPVPFSTRITRYFPFQTDPRGTEYPFRGGLAVLLPTSVCK